MPETVFDVIVIGAGPTGENVADRAVKGGLTAAIVESNLAGGECSYCGVHSQQGIAPQFGGAAGRAARGWRETGHYRPARCLRCSGAAHPLHRLLEGRQPGGMDQERQGHLCARPWTAGGRANRRSGRRRWFRHAAHRAPCRCHLHGNQSHASSCPRTLPKLRPGPIGKPPAPIVSRAVWPCSEADLWRANWARPSITSVPGK